MSARDNTAKACLQTIIDLANDMDDIPEDAFDEVDFCSADDENANWERRYSARGIASSISAIGEEICHLPNVLKDKHPDVAWDDFEEFRHITSHEYQNVMLSDAWVLWKEELPKLVEACETELESLVFGFDYYDV